MLWSNSTSKSLWHLLQCSEHAGVHAGQCLATKLQVIGPLTGTTCVYLGNLQSFMCRQVVVGHLCVA